MTRALASITILALLLFLAGPAVAQQSSSPRPPAGGTQPAPTPPQPGPWMGPGGGMGAMHEYMHGPGGMYGAGGACGPMGMFGFGGQNLDPRTRGLMMQMRGEMMKAMGDVLLKYGKLMETQSR